MMTKRNQEAWDKMTPEQREAVERIRASHQTPEYRAETEAIRREVPLEHPPATADEGLVTLLAMLRLERERQGLSLADVQAKTRIAKGDLSKLETGKVANPTWNTLRAMANALDVRIVCGIEPRGNREGAEECSVEGSEAASAAESGF